MSMYIPAGCTLTITGPQVVEVGLGAHYGQSQGYSPAPVAHGTPMQVPGQVPYATPSATPGMVPTPMTVPGQVPYATPTPMDTPPPMLPHGTPALWPTPPMNLTAPPQRPYDVPPPTLGNDKTPHLVPPHLLPYVKADSYRAFMEKKAARALEQAAAEQMEAAAHQQMMDEALEAMRKDDARRAAQWGADDGQGAMGGGAPDKGAKPAPAPADDGLGAARPKM